MAFQPGIGDLEVGSMRQAILLVTLLLSAPRESVSSAQRQLPITVEAQAASRDTKSGTTLLLRITISNGLSQDIRFSTFSLTPNSWNGEVTNISLVDIYRDNAGPMGLFLARPKSGEVPRFIAGISSHTIKPRASLSVLVDMGKWQIRDGWVPGKYRITVRVDNISVDDYATASVMSDPVEIEIK